MVGLSYKDLCEYRLWLDPNGHQKLKEAAKNFLTGWRETYAKTETQDEQRLYDADTLHRMATTYVEEGWNSDTLKIDPGKDLWKEPDTTSDRRVKIYPQDKDL